MATISSGVLWDDSFVKPTMSLKKMVTHSYVSGCTDLPRLSWSAIELQRPEQTLETL